MLDIGAALYGIAHPGKLLPKGLIGKGAVDGGVHVLPDQAPHRGLAALPGAPFRIVLSLGLRLDDGNAVGAAHLVGDTPNIPVVVLERIAEFSAVHKAYGIEQDMTVKMVVVQMGGNDSLVFVTQQPLGQLHSHLVGLHGRHLAGGVGMDDMVALHAAALAPAALGIHHVPVGGIQLAVDCGGKAGASIRQAGFFRVEYIVGTVIQPCPYGDDFVIGHYTASRTSRHACCTNSDAAWISARVASPRALA